MSKTMQVAIIGLGYWGPNFARLCFEVNGINLKYCCDLDTVSLEKIKKKFPSVTTITNYHEILADKNVNAVIVVTPPHTHYSICRDIMESGKDVLVEKPITLKETHAEKLIQLAGRKKRIIMVDHIFKFNSGITKLKQIIQNGSMGKIFYLSGSYTALGPVRSDVDAILDLAPHHFYTLNYITSQNPIWISAVGQSYLKEGNSDVAFISIMYPNNILAQIHVSWLYPFKVRDIVVIGEKKMAVFDDTSPSEKLKIFDKSAFFDTKSPEYPAILKIIYREGDIISPRLEPNEPLKDVLINFRDSVLSRKEPISPASEGKVVVAMLNAAKKSLQKNGKKIMLYEE